MDDTRNPTQDGQANVDQEVRAASALQEDTQRGQDEGQDELADVTEANNISIQILRNVVASPRLWQQGSGFRDHRRQVGRGKERLTKQ